MWPEPQYYFCPLRRACMSASRNIANMISCRVFDTCSPNLHQRCIMGQRWTSHSLGSKDQRSMSLWDKVCWKQHFLGLLTPGLKVGKKKYGYDPFPSPPPFPFPLPFPSPLLPSPLLPFHALPQWRREGFCRPGQTSVLPPPLVRSAITTYDPELLSSRKVLVLEDPRGPIYKSLSSSSDKKP